MGASGVQSSGFSLRIELGVEGRDKSDLYIFHLLKFITNSEFDQRISRLKILIIKIRLISTLIVP